jgi:hypothetical protein
MISERRTSGATQSGVAVGADHYSSLNTLACFSLAAGGGSFSTANNSSGSSDLVQVVRSCALRPDQLRSQQWHPMAGRISQPIALSAPIAHSSMSTAIRVASSHVRVISIATVSAAFHPLPAGSFVVNRPQRARLRS